jgi:hypothetical protein
MSKFFITIEYHLPVGIPVQFQRLVTLVTLEHEDGARVGAAGDDDGDLPVVEVEP